jgi:predicted NBD/HSP70 family sugar kinase
LNRSTIKHLVAELCDLKVVGEQIPLQQPGRAGRPSTEVFLRMDAPTSLAVDIQVGEIAMARVALGGRVLAESRRLHIVNTGDPSQVAQVIRAGLAEQELAAKLSGQGPVIGVGVAVPGTVRRSDGCVRMGPNLAWVDAPLGDILRAELGPVRMAISNDGEAGAWAEHRHGAGRGVDDLVFIVGHVGVGGGLIVGGVAVGGWHGYAGEVGHMVVRPRGRLCRCGARGCWETEIGTESIGKALGVSPREVERALRGMDDAPEKLREIRNWVNRGLVTLANILNPELIIVGGLLGHVMTVTGLMGVESRERGIAGATLEPFRVVPAALGPESSLVGAVEPIWEQLFADPVGVLRAAHPG